MTTGQRVWWLTWVLGDPISSRANPSVPRDQNPVRGSGAALWFSGWQAGGQPVGGRGVFCVPGIVPPQTIIWRPVQTAVGLLRPRNGAMGIADHRLAAGS